MTTRFRSHLVALLLSLSTPVTAATDPGLAGPYPTERWTTPVPATLAANLTTDIHYPGALGVVDATAVPCPVVVIGHGFARSKTQFTELGAHLASRGYLVLIPNFSGSDHSRNGDDLVAMIDWVLAQDRNPTSRLYLSLDRAAIGAAGHSAGGLAAILAASRDPRIVALSAMDPVDNAGLGASALASVTIPVAVTHSEDSSCNAAGSSRVLYAAASAPRRRVEVERGTHCDPEQPSDLLCTLVCGATDPERQYLYRKYLTGWFEYFLRCDDSYESWVYGTELRADAAAGRVTYESDPTTVTPPCAGQLPGPVKPLYLVRRGADVVASWLPVAALPAVTEYGLDRASGLRLAAPIRVATTPTTTWTDLDALLRAGDESYGVRATNPSGEGP